MRVFNGQEMYKDLSRTCTAFVLLIYPFVSWRTRCCRRGGLLKFPYNDVDHDELRPWQTRTHCCRHKCFPICPHAQHLLWTQILCLCSETFCVCIKCFPVCAAQETLWATMCPQQCVLVCQGLYRNRYKLQHDLISQCKPPRSL